MIIKYFSYEKHNHKSAIITILLSFILLFFSIKSNSADSELKEIPIEKEEKQEDEKIIEYSPDNIPSEVKEKILNSFEELLDRDHFDLMNGNLWALKALFYLWTPLFCGANTLIIAKTDAVTPQLVIAAQFTVPRTIEAICFVIDKARIIYKESQISNWYKQLPTEFNKKPCTTIFKNVWAITRLGAGLYLGYAYSLIDAETAGDAYRWIAESHTSDKRSLDNADNTAFAFNFSYTALLGAIFFYQLIDEIVMRTGLGYLIGISPPPTKDFDYEENMDELKEISYRVHGVLQYNNQEIVTKEINEYLSDRNINSLYKVSSLQRCLLNEVYPKGKYTNLLLNVAYKLSVIIGATVICGISFKYIFASGLILRNYVNEVGNKLDNGTYVFKTKNGSDFLCDSVSDCTEGVDFDNIIITDSEKDKLLDLSFKADLANILQGISISADTAVLVLATISFFNDYIKKTRVRHAINNGMYKKSKIPQYIGAILIAPAMFFYLDNVNNVRPVAKTSNSLLKSTGQESFIGVDFGIITTIFVLGTTFSLGTRLLSNLPNALISIPNKLSSIPESVKKLCRR